MFNIAIIEGRLTSDIELQTSKNDKTYCKFSVAVDEGFGEEKRTNFISCVAWNKTAEFVSKYFSKGKLIGVEGTILTGSYEKDGKKIYTTDIVVKNVHFVGNKNDNQAQEPTVKAESTNGFMTLPDDGDDLPFN